MNYDEIETIRATAIRLHLIGAQWLAYMPIDVLAKCYNGTGPEFLPQAIRDKLDAVCRPFLPAVMIHDVDFTMSDGTRRPFLTANQHLLWNCITCANSVYPWTSWRRYALYLEAWAMYRAVSHDQFGWVAWQQACDKRQ